MKDLKGQTFGRLTVIEHIGFTKSRNAIWKCQCVCGNVKDVRSADLIKGTTQSCGCLFKEVAGSYKKLDRGLAARNDLYAKYKRKAQARNIVFDLPIDVFETITQKNCYYCGIQPYRENRINNKTGSYIYNGIDRVDNTKGYVENNVVACCKHCNQAKSDMTVKEFDAWIIRLHNHRKNTL